MNKLEIHQISSELVMISNNTNGKRSEMVRIVQHFSFPVAFCLLIGSRLKMY